MTSLKTLLIVDDEHALREGIKDTINWANNGFKIIGEAANGEQALLMIDQKKPDFILTDIVMPLMDGIQLTKEIRQSGNQTPIIILSNYSDFKYVKEALTNGANDYLLKATFTEDELFSLLERLSEKKIKAVPTLISFQDRLLNSLSHGNIFSQTTLKDFSKKKKQFFLITDSRFYDNHNQVHLEFPIKDILKECLIETCYYQQYIIFFIDTDDSSLKIEHLINQWFSNHRHSSAFFFALSDNFSDSQVSVNQTLSATIKRLSLRFYLNNQNFLTNKTNITVHSLPTFDYRLFDLALSKYNETGALGLVSNYLTNLSAHYYEEEIKNFTTGILFQIFNHVEQTYPHYPNISQAKLLTLKKINSAFYFQELIATVNDIIDDIKNAINRQKNSDNQDFWLEISDYIQERANQKISLQDIADHFHFNYSYLSTYFSEKMNMNFTDFLTKVRIEKAQLLLQDKTYNISEVSEAVGYTDTSYFSKVFKRETGFTPSEFKRKRARK